MDGPQQVRWATITESKAHMNPKVFISHASEDKERFVLRFAIRLRAHGLDVWVDKWEMLPGDSLVTKIFTEGLDASSAVIVVISQHSIKKRWVAEELDAAVVKRIEEGSKLIPVVLDGLVPSQVPAPIRHLLFEPVNDLEEIEMVVDRVVRAILGQSEKPPLAELPQYANSAIVQVSGLDRIDNLVLRAAGEEAIRDFGTLFETSEFVQSITESLEVSESDATESLEVLDNDRLIKIQRPLGSGLSSMKRFVLSPHGLETYLRAYEPNYSTMEETVLSRLASWPDDQGIESELSASVEAPRLIVRHVLDRYAARGLIGVSKTANGTMDFHSISPKLRRLSR